MSFVIEIRAQPDLLAAIDGLTRAMGEVASALRGGVARAPVAAAEPMAAAPRVEPAAVAVAGPAPAPTPDGKEKRWTPERDKLLREHYGTALPVRDLLVTVNALPGRPVTNKQLRSRASQFGLRLPKERTARYADKLALMNAARYGGKRDAAPRETPPPPVVDPAPAPVTSAPAPAPAPPKPLPAFSPARDAIIARDFAAGRPLADIATTCNRLPGHSVTAAAISMRAVMLGMRRPSAAPPPSTEPIETDLSTVIAWAAARGISMRSAADLAVVNAKARALGLREFRLPERRRA